jgi:D-beta-D-heptose 7-phosphate kinase/D-beta-D-heptose 1-phosphate adenosyltransferase
MSGRAPESKVLSREEAIERFGRPRQDPVVFTNGCFDLLHRGHASYLNAAKALGASLVVGVNTDASVQRLDKGSGRPFVSEADRAYLLASLECVDAVCLFDEDTPLQLISALLPDVLVKGADYALDQVVGREAVEAAGGRVVLVPLVSGYSTSALLKRIRKKD